MQDFRNPADRRGKRPGACAKYTHEQLETMGALHKEGLSEGEIAKKMGVSKNAISGLVNRWPDYFPHYLRGEGRTGGRCKRGIWSKDSPAPITLPFVRCLQEAAL
jgi:hypothetical protein